MCDPLGCIIFAFDESQEGTRDDGSSDDRRRGKVGFSREDFLEFAPDAAGILLRPAWEDRPHNVLMIQPPPSDDPIIAATPPSGDPIIAATPQ